MQYDEEAKEITTLRYNQIIKAASSEIENDYGLRSVADAKTMAASNLHHSMNQQEFR